ncbi:peptidoglycan DD-metalloendopeptidase family protein [Nakamurella sp. YIM 132087]|uniref:Peptidoglycan DD-metalloendopeptidase family protein n=2 Tax=Nakamurella alba TaxID=2665158 RepID=A0A7K1FME8_9ACTN|nr:peptidoglycan DD-metalloendopeptidase family protein [Nakamurella alba]
MPDGVPAVHRLLARTGGIAAPVGAVLVVAVAALALFGPDPVPSGIRVVTLPVAVIGVLLLGAGTVSLFLRPTLRRSPVRLAPPVTGRWVAVNSPATKVPSHGTHAYGQTFAVDLVLDDPDSGRRRPEHGGAQAFRAPTDYPAFGVPLRSPVDGTVVRVRDSQRDHRARANAAGVAYMVLDGLVRELGGPGRVLGNHLVLRADTGEFVLLAHLQQGSAEVRVGDRVGIGDPLARCGNTGNSSEPHLHLQVMDHPRPGRAVGLPMTFRGEGAAPDRVPADNEAMTV